MQEEIGQTINSPIFFRIYEFSERSNYIFWSRADFDLGTIKLTEGQRLQWFRHEEVMATPENSFAFGFKKVVVDFFREAPWEGTSDSQAQISPPPTE